MAHAATLNVLTEGLINAITGQATDEKSFARLRDRAIKGLRDQSHTRTNQFAVKSTLDGLIEKFAILDRDDLADGLQSRLDELPKDPKWLPEILSLLLELSDRPADKTTFTDVLNANKAAEQKHELTWDEIVADDPLDESDIWESVERGYHSSGDDEFDNVESEPTTSTTATSVDDQDPSAIARLRLIQPNPSALDRVRAARSAWQELFRPGQGSKLSELTVVREILSMFHGSSTDLFRQDNASGRVTFARKISLSGVSDCSLTDLLESAVATGRALNSLRRWVSTPQHLTFQRSLQSSIQLLISDFDKQVAEIETRFAAPLLDIVVSVVDVITEIQQASTSLTRLSLLTQLSAMSIGPTAPFALLDYLFDEVGTAQMAGDVLLLKDLSDVLFVSLSTYLRSASHWMIDGLLASERDETFFILDGSPDCKPSELWRGRYEQRCQIDGTPITPRCVAPFAKRIFALGKARLFLTQIEPTIESAQLRPAAMCVPDFANVKDALRDDTLMPISQLVSNHLDAWISEIGVDCTPLLRSKILNEHGLARTVTALPHVFFSYNGALLQTFAESLFARMGEISTATTWNDQFFLTKLAQATLGSAAEVDSENIFVNGSDLEPNAKSISVTRKLESLNIGYSFSWPAQNITGCSAAESHSRVLVLLLQLHHAATLVRGQIFDLRANKNARPPVFRLRKGLLWFIELLQSHVTITAYEVHREFCSVLHEGQDIDAMVLAWADYVNRIQTTLLLTETLQPVRNAIIEALELNEALAKNSHAEGVATPQDQFDRLLRFLIAGVRGVSRAGGQPALEALAERLEWGVRAHTT